MNNLVFDTKTTTKKTETVENSYSSVALNVQSPIKKYVSCQVQGSNGQYDMVDNTDTANLNYQEE